MKLSRRLLARCRESAGELSWPTGLAVTKTDKPPPQPSARVVTHPHHATGAGQTKTAGKTGYVQELLKKKKDARQQGESLRCDGKCGRAHTANGGGLSFTDLLQIEGNSTGMRAFALIGLGNF